jgi:ABC-type phosphate/phosphonate transport system ATPase subunit
MIELLGLGVPRARGAGWLLHRVCARVDARALTVVVSRDAGERLALLDAVAGRLLPDEGRVYIGRTPITRDTRGRLRNLVADADLSLPLMPSRSLLWNTLAGRSPGTRALLGFLRLPRPRERAAALAALTRLHLGERARWPVSRLGAEERARVIVARELARRPEYVVVREVDAGLGPGESGALLTALRGLAHADGVGVLASASSWSLARAHADRVLALTEGLLVFAGGPTLGSDAALARHLGPSGPQE